MIVITSGKKYLDIDGYASSIAYRELLKMQSLEAKFVSNAILNYSITKSLLALSFSVDKYEVNEKDNFIIIDLSNKDFFESFIEENKIIELIDHHFGFEDYWDKKQGNKVLIEPIGAVATIIVEKYQENNLLSKMSKDIAKLLMAAILDNTLNFTANITKTRDKEAYYQLTELTGISNFSEIYFKEVQKVIESNLSNSIENDLKVEETSNYLPKTLGQLTVYEISTILEKIEIIKNTMNKYAKDWLINIICLKENKSYLICSTKNVQNKVAKLFNINSDKDILTLKPAILRKEILKRSLEFKKTL